MKFQSQIDAVLNVGLQNVPESAGMEASKSSDFEENPFGIAARRSPQLRVLGGPGVRLHAKLAKNAK
jgi:hypothetical protein